MTQDVHTTDAAFATFPLPEGAQGHFLLHFYAVIARIIAHLDNEDAHPDSTSPFEQFPFLAGYHTLLQAFVPDIITRDEQDAFWEAYILRWESHASEAGEADNIGGIGKTNETDKSVESLRASLHLPLKALREALGLGVGEMLFLIAVGLVEEDIRFGTLFATLQAPLPARRPCLGVLGWLLSPHASGHAPIDLWATCRALLDANLLQIENATDARAEWILRVPASLWDALRGQVHAQPVPGVQFVALHHSPALHALIVPATLSERLLHLPDLLTSGLVQTIVLRGMHGSGRRTLLTAIARFLHRHTLLWEAGKPGDESWRLLGPLATLTGAMPVLRLDPMPGETLDLPALQGYSGPVGITLGRGGGLRGSLMAHALSLQIPAPDKTARHRFWESTHVALQADEMEDIVAHFLFTGGHICTAATLAQAYAALEKRQTIAAHDVRQASRTLNRQALETLATALEPARGWSDLVMNQAALEELLALETRCRQREMLHGYSGPALKHSINRGVRALFSGASGTGKTLAARALAAALNMDVYRVDLAAVVNKYIGETERNLNQVLSRAEELDVVLLLDEGDALMTNRTDVRSANDRYANLETNYLLQRLETYEGIVIITTNASSRIDAAFLRRIDAIIDFTQPEAPERWHIWQSHLSATHTVRPAFLQEVATRCVLTGGQIRNAALHATLLALESAALVDDSHVERAVRREYRKIGAACPLRVL